MSESWVVGYRSALARTIARLGYPWLELESAWRGFSSPLDYEGKEALLEHLKVDAEWSLTEDPTEKIWWEFTGTFTEPGEGRKVGMIATVSCSCGQYRDLVVGVSDTTFSDLLQALLKEPGQ